MKRFRMIIFVVVIAFFTLCLASCNSNRTPIDDSAVYYQAQGLELNDKYFSIRKMSVWQDKAYILVLDKEIYQNNLNWILIVDSTGKTLAEISYSTKGSNSVEDWFYGNDIVDIEVDNNGGIWLLEETSAIKYGDTGEIIDSQMEYDVISINEEGIVLDTFVLTEINNMNNSGEAPFVHNFIIDNDGNFFFISNAGTGDILYIYNNQKEFINTPKRNVTAVSKSEDGQVLAQVVSDAEGKDIELKTLDTALWNWETSVKTSNYYSFIYTGVSYDYILNDGSNLYGYTMENDEYVELLNWLDCDFTSGHVQCLGEISDGRLFVLATSLDTLTEDIFILEPISANLRPERTIITLATGIATENTKKQVVEFNRTHQDYKITLTEYFITDNIYDDMYDGLNKFLTEVTAGKIPDIIDFYFLPAQTLISAGIMEDLNLYLARDAEISAEDFLPNLISALEVDGALYQLPYEFYLSIMAGDSDVVGDKQGWTLEDLYRLMAQNEQYQNVCHPSYSQIDFLVNAIRFTPDSWINWQDGTCNFESDGFIALLQFAKDYFSSGQIVYSIDVFEQFEHITNDEYPLILTEAFSINDILGCNTAFDGNVNFIGFPTEQGIGNAFFLCENFGITRTSENKGVAWEFIRGFFLDNKYDIQSYPFFPSTINMLEKLVSNGMEEFQNNNPDYDYSGVGDEYRRYYKERGTHVFTQDGVDMFWELLFSIDRVRSNNDSIEKIIIEEANYFFMDDKPAEDVAKIIQDKVQTFLSERKRQALCHIAKAACE